MEPKKVGRTLGIGVRVASNMLRQRVEQAAAAQPGPVEAGNGRPAAPPRPAPASPSLSSRAATAKRGAKAFGQALLGPFTHAGSVLWLEISGLFFALFADVLHYLGDLLGLGNRLMNGFPQLLDKTTKSLVQ